MTPEVTLNLPVAKARKTYQIARYLPAGARGLLGFLFCLSGLNGFLNFLPQPSTPLAEGAQAFTGALMATGYMFPLIMATQLMVGVLLLSNRFVPLALTLLAPFMVNSIAFHTFLEPTGRPMALIVVAMQLYLAWSYRAWYRTVLTMRAVPQQA